MQQKSPLHTFLQEIRATEIESVIHAAMQNTGSRFDYSDVTFPEELEEGESPIPKDHVRITDPGSSILVSKEAFIRALRERALELGL